MIPPSITITQHGAAKMSISPPRLNLRRAGSYNIADKGPLSSSSARFGFDHLAFYSPPPSPGLPLPQHAPRPRRKPSNAPRPSRVIRFCLWLSGVLLFIYVAGKSIRKHAGQTMGSMPEKLLGAWVRGSWEDGSAKEYEMVAQDDLPDFPTPIIVTDRRGRAQWTISIPPSYQFPLTQREYVDMCGKCKEVAARVDSMHSHSAVTTAIDQISLMAGGAGTAAETDKYFLDIRDAQRQGFLRRSPHGKAGSVGELLGVDGDSLVMKTVCASSLTFVLESDDVGLGTTLMALWMAYGLAQREDRAFFIEDARWAYGAYTSLFAAPSVPACKPPPRQEMLPCPRQARHLVVSAANARDLLGGALDPDTIIYARGGRQADLDRPGQRALYGLARAGHDALFRLTAPDREYVVARVQEHRDRTLAVDGAAHNGRVVGVHVRHGDRHPLESQYTDSYIPLTQYVEAASELLNASLARAGGRGARTDKDRDDDDNAHDPVARQKSFVVVASDDPLVYDAGEFAAAGLATVRAQELIRLAGKEEVDGGGGDAPAKEPKNVMHRFKAESFGWEGGFFSRMFENLGASAAAADTTVPPSAETLALRQFVGRAYLMDLAALSAMTDGEGGGGVVCAVSAMGCRLLAVMMGEERAFGRGEWLNVDGGFGWNGFLG